MKDCSCLVNIQTIDGQAAYTYDIEYCALHAAAPELLDACEWAYKSWARGKPIPGVDLCALLGQAMNKAKGKS